MVQLEDENFLKLKKDADDNIQLKKIVAIVVAGIIAVITIIFVIRPILEPYWKANAAQIDREIAEEDARSAVRIREIEMGNLSFQEYKEWCDIVYAD